MLLAEIRGKSLGAARDNEDYLTSAVFGHLRYVPPTVFWDSLFAHAKGLPGPDGIERSLANILATAARPPSAYRALTVEFWQPHPTLGEPDLWLMFTGPVVPPLVILIEAKLWSAKSGTGEHDQLGRYLQVLDDLGPVLPGVPPEAIRYLVYLTPCDSLAELEESAASPACPDGSRSRLFRLRWQDVRVEAGQAARGAPEPSRTVLSGVAAFLQRLGLEPFDGFLSDDTLPWIEVRPAAFGSPLVAGFQGFHRNDTLEFIEILGGEWTA